MLVNTKTSALRIQICNGFYQDFSVTLTGNKTFSSPSPPPFFFFFVSFYVGCPKLVLAGGCVYKNKINKTSMFLWLSSWVLDSNTMRLQSFFSLAYGKRDLIKLGVLVFCQVFRAGYILTTICDQNSCSSVTTEPFRLLLES